MAAANNGPTDIPSLKAKLKEYGVTDADLELFQEEIEEEDYDLEAIVEDVRHGIQESMLVESFKEKYEMGQDLYFLLKDIVEGKEPEKKEVAETKEDLKEDEPEEPENGDPKSSTAKTGDVKIDGATISAMKETSASSTANSSNNQSGKPGLGATNDAVNDPSQFGDEKEEEEPTADNQYIHSFIRKELKALKQEKNNKVDDKQGSDGTVILDPALLEIPYKAISYAFCLENMKGIHYILMHNHVNPSKEGTRLISTKYLEFWENFLDEEETYTFEMMKDEIKNNQGALYDNMMENPPSDRLLPVLEKLVDQLACPRLLRGVRKTEEQKEESKQADSNKVDDNNPHIQFFKRMPLFHQDLISNRDTKEWVYNLATACELFQKNVDENNYDRYELMVTVFDIFHCLLYDRKENNAMKSVTNHLRRFFNDHNRIESKYYASLEKTFISLHSDTAMAKLFRPLTSPQKDDKIADDLMAFQSVSCSFLLFVKAFICESGNKLELKGHQKKTKKKASKKAKTIIKSLLQCKKDAKNKKGKVGGKELSKVIITGDDINFHNLNFPLQFDFVVIPKGQKRVEIEEKGNAFEIVSKELKPEHFTTQKVYTLYGMMVDLFREMLDKEKNKNQGPKSMENEDENDKDKDDEEVERRDDRYCIVIDRNNNTMYMFPPNVQNGVHDGGNDTIVHRKRPQQKQTNKSSKSKPATNDEEEKDQEVDNKFSLIPHEYNDFTNFYLSQNGCLMLEMDKKQKSFMLSAHFHIQKEWHRHPKLRVYQYFNGKGIRFFHSWRDMTGYYAKKDITRLWPNHFEPDYAKKGMSEKDVADLQLFDAVMDLYKCDPNFLRWDCAVKRIWTTAERYELGHLTDGEYIIEAYDGPMKVGYLGAKGQKEVEISAKAIDWTVKEHKKIRRRKKETAKEELEEVDKIVYTLHSGKNLFLEAKEDDDGKKIVSNNKKDVKDMIEKKPKTQYAWVFERYYQAKDHQDKDKSPINGTLSIKSVHNNRYLNDLINTKKKISHWRIIPKNEE